MGSLSTGSFKALRKLARKFAGTKRKKPVRHAVHRGGKTYWRGQGAPSPAEQDADVKGFADRWAGHLYSRWSDQRSENGPNIRDAERQLRDSLNEVARHTMTVEGRVFTERRNARSLEIEIERAVDRCITEFGTAKTDDEKKATLQRWHCHAVIMARSNSSRLPARV